MNSYPTQTKRTAVADATQGVKVLAVLVLAVIIVGGPNALAVARAVVNLPFSAVAIVWGRAHGGTCVIHEDLVITCDSMDSGFTDAGTTVGNVWLYDTLDGPDRHRHEARHADQWAVLGSSFPVLYGAEYVRTGGRQQNVFEEWAGLHDGGYLP
jgi:hypothetical protein